MLRRGASIRKSPSFLNSIGIGRIGNRLDVAWDNGTVPIMSTEGTPDSQPTPEVPESNSEQGTAPASEPPSAPREPSPEPAINITEAEAPAEPEENFADILSQFERSHAHKAESGARQIEGTVISLSAEQVFLDIGYKTEGVLPRSAFPNNAQGVKPGDKVPVSVKGRNEEGYYDLLAVRRQLGYPD